MKSWDDPQCETLSPVATRATVAAALQEALAELLAAEQAVLEVTLELDRARNTLQFYEDRLRVADPCPLDGKTAEDRASQLRRLTIGQVCAVKDGEHARLRAASALAGARATFSAQKLLARLLAGEDR